MTRRRQSDVWITVVAMLAASVVIHVALWPVGDRVIGMDWRGPPISVQGGVMEVSLVPSGVGSAEEQEPDDEDERRPVPEEEEERERRPTDGPLVKLDRLVDERTPEDARFLSEFDNRVEHQTRAPLRRPRDGASATTPGDRPDADQATSLRPMLPTAARPLPLGQRLGSAAEGSGSSAQAMIDRAEDGSLATDAGAAGRSAIPGLRGSPDAMRRTLGSSGTYDPVGDIDEGEENVLNSKRWRFASFFNRVRDGVAQHWRPEEVHRSRDPEGRVHGTKTRITRLGIRLNSDGSVARIHVERPSGVDYLDEEAIRAVRAAQPFSNPPPQLVDPVTGYIDFDFGFIFEIHGRTRIFRYR